VADKKRMDDAVTIHVNSEKDGAPGSGTPSDGLLAGAALISVGLVTVVLGQWLRVTNAAVVSTAYLLVVLVVAATGRLWIAVATSIVATLSLDFFFLPPVGTLTVDDPHNWVALFAFLAVSLVASNLSAVARARTERAMDRRDELTRLFDLSRDILQTTESREALSVLARAIARRFDLDLVAIALPRADEWDVFDGGAVMMRLDPRQLSYAFITLQPLPEFDASTRTYSGHRSMTVDGRSVRLVPLRVGTKPIGLLAAAGRPVDAGRSAAAPRLVRRGARPAHRGSAC